MNTPETPVKSMLTRRALLMHKDNKSVPSHHEAMSNLGTFLGETVLNEMSPVAKEMMGIDKPFPVAPKTVWLSPDDRTHGNIILKPPPNDDVIKALAHEGILEIGSTVEAKLEKHWLERIRAAKKEVEDFERFECNNRIKFALEQERLTHEAALKQQRLDLLKMFQKDREELIEVSKTELETMTKKLTNEHEMKRAREIERSVEMVELSASKKINELSKRIGMLEGELVEKEAMITSEVEKRRHRDWHILHELFMEMQRQFSTKLKILQNQHNAEIRQLYLEIKTQIVDSEQETTVNEDLSDGESLISDREPEKIEFTDEGGPFIINVCKVEGETSEEDKSPNDDDDSTASSFKCYKHRSKPKSENIYDHQGYLDSTIRYGQSDGADMFDVNDINTTDVSCDILRKLGLNFNVANIEKVKVELDNLLLNINNRGETKLLTATDSLELVVYESANKTVNVPECEEYDRKQEPQYDDREEYRRLMNRKKSKKLNETKLAIPLTVDEYMDTLIPIPKYMTTERACISIWDYKAMTDDEWNSLLAEFDDKIQTESNEISSKMKNVTVTSPNSMESSSVESTERIVSNSSRKPVRGILRSSLENKTDSKDLMKNEFFQTDEMQSLVKELSNE